MMRPPSPQAGLNVNMFMSYYQNLQPWKAVTTSTPQISSILSRIEVRSETRSQPPTESDGDVCDCDSSAQAWIARMP